MGRAPCCDKASVKKGPWSPEEDAKLKAYIEENGTGGNWIALPHKIGLKRCGKSCRLRWLNYLRPNIKHGGFSEEEDQIICSLYISIGSRWSIIAAQLPGRTDNDIKNYWNTRLKKKLLGKKRESSQSKRLSLSQGTTEEALEGTIHQTPLQSLSSSALERMQLHMQLQGLYNPFSFHNINPSLWHNHHPLGERIVQSQQTDAIATTLVPQALGITAAVGQSHQDAFAARSCHEMLSSMSSANMQEERDSSSPLGFNSPPLSSSTGTLSMESSSSKFDSFTAGIHAELNDILYSKNPSFGLHEDHQISDLDCYKDIYGEKESTNTWWPSNGFEDSASVLHPEFIVLQEYEQQYETYRHRDY